METDFDLDVSGISSASGSSAGTVGGYAMTRLLESQARHVELLSHLASYSELLVAVVGPEGSGKSVIANALAAQREAPDETLHLTASVMLGLPAVLSAIANHWDMPAIHSDSAQSREAIRNEALARADEGGSLLLVIDQADQLDAETLNDIAHFALIAPQAISVALFGQSGFETQFRNSPAQAPVHILNIEPLADHEVETLVTNVYGDGAVCPLNNKELSQLMAGTGCWPGTVLVGAERMLAAPVRSGSAGSEASRAKGTFPVQNILAIAGVATLVVMLLIYQYGWQEEVTPTEAAVEPAVVQQPADFNYPDSNTQNPVAAAAPAEAVDTTQLAVRDVASVDTSAGTSAGVSEASQQRPAATPVSGGVAEKSAIASPAASETEIKAETKPEVKPAPEQVAAQVAPTQSYTPDEQALLAPTSGYIVQLLGSYSSDGASNFRNEWKNKVTGNLYKYQTTHNNRDWYVVVSGVYSGRAEASAAVNALPASLRKQSPWIRPVADVQKVIR